MVDLSSWGKLAGGTPVFLATLRDDAGLAVLVSSYGATLVDIRTPDSRGRIDSILLGPGSLSACLDPALQAAWPYFGSTVGRYANRISNARFAIDGVEYRLSANEGRHHLHGGFHGFDRRLWHACAIDGEEGVRMTLVSPAGDEGFPGALHVIAEFRIAATGTLAIRYTATTDAPTHVNIASHGYFNLAGRAARGVAAQDIQVAADRYLPIDAEALPTGGLADVGGTPFDLRRPAALADILTSDHPQIAAHAGLNHCFALNRSGGAAAHLHDPVSGRRLALSTTAPGLQVYTANGFDGSIADSAGRPFVRHQAVALEAQYFPDSPSHAHFPTTLVRPGESFTSETILRFSAD